MMNNLPLNWESWRLADVGQWCGGGTPSSSNAAYWDGDIPWVSPKDMKVQRITTSIDAITQAAVANSAAKLIPEGAVLFVTRSGILAHSFPVATTGVKVTVNQDLKAISPVEVIDQSYLAWTLRALERKILTSCSKHGTTVHSIEIPSLKELRIPIPPFAEQHRIVAKIEELFSELDKGVENLTTAREQLKAYRQSVLKAAFEGKLTENWRAKNTKTLESAESLVARIKKERVDHYQAALDDWDAAYMKWRTNGEAGVKPAKPRKLKPSASALVGSNSSLPSEWRWTLVSEFADLVTDGTHHTPTYAASGIPFISVKDIYDGAVHFDDCKFISRDEHDVLVQRCKPEPGDLLITKSGTIGRLAIVPEGEFSLFVSVALIKIQSAKAHIDPRWLRYVFEHHIMTLNIDQDIKGGLLKNYHLEDLRVARLPLCGIAEQQALATLIEEKLTVADNFAATIENELKRIDGLRQAILKRAFSGQLVAQDPADEPASVLLERIRAERDENGTTKRRNNKNGKKVAA